MTRDTLVDMANTSTNETASLSSLRSFAHKRGVEEKTVLLIYEEEIHRLDLDARVKKYLPILAEKRTKNRLRAS